VSALAKRIQVPLPPWLPQAAALDDWQTSAWDELFPSIHHTLQKVMQPVRGKGDVHPFDRKIYARIAVSGRVVQHKADPAVSFHHV
jgi:hypothetical protein